MRNEGSGSTRQSSSARRLHYTSGGNVEPRQHRAQRPAVGVSDTYTTHPACQGLGTRTAHTKTDMGRDVMAPIHNLTMQDMNNVIKTLNLRHGANTEILNGGQLDFALQKPSMSLYGREMYPEMYQKAATLMESICKSHCLTDGNKRSSMMAAEYFVNINGATLVLPLKSIRLTVDCAMDADDKMSEELSMWFKTHIAVNPLQLSVMLEELIEEREIVTSLWKLG